MVYETVQRVDYSLPLFAPMSKIAGRMALIMGQDFWQNMRWAKVF
jgi:Alanine dehydrogenase